MELRKQITALFAQVLPSFADDIATDADLVCVRKNPKLSARLCKLMNRRFNIAIRPADLYGINTIRGLERHITQLMIQKSSNKFRQAKSQDVAAEPLISGNTIAVVGMAGHFAGSNGLEQFWETITQAKPCFSETRRWKVQDNEKFLGGFIDNHDCFDPGFFKISPNEAKCMDPQQRILMQTVQHAIDDSYMAVEELRALRCGVFSAGLPGDYKFVLAKHPDMAFNTYSFLGNAASSLSGRISYFYNFDGPSLTLDTACSSSVMAVHEACLNIQAGHCQAAIVGAVSVFSTPELFRFAQRSNMASKMGRCATFGEEADGFVLGEGSAAVILVQYEEARTRGLRIYGLIMATGANHDGKSNGLMAPNPKAQAMLIRDLYRRHGVKPDNLAYVETHGTGTHLGDPIEMRALTEAFSEIDSKYDCYLGAVKPLIGHTLVCSGLAGIIKVLLSFKYGIIPPFPTISQPNKMVDFGGFQMNSEALIWPDDKSLCAVSAFGFTGANSHVILQRPPYTPVQSCKRVQGVVLPFCLSARHGNSLIRSVQQYRRVVEAIAEEKLYDLSQLMLRRPCYDLHCVIAAADKDDLLKQLSQLEQNLEMCKTINDHAASCLSVAMRSLISLWESENYMALHCHLDKVNSLSANIYVPAYPFDVKPYWADKDEKETVLPSAPLQTLGQEQEAVLDDVKKSLADLLGFSLEELREDMLVSDLGLDSLSALKLLAPYQHRGLKIQAYDLLQFKTLADLAAAIAATCVDNTSFKQSSHVPTLPRTPLQDVKAGIIDARKPMIQWLSYGEGSQTVILAPPLNTASEAWPQQINVLVQAGRKIFVPVYPGHKGTPFCAESFSLNNLADQFVAFINHELKSTSVDLVGWSLGGCISCLVAIRNPELVRSLTLISTAARFNENVFDNTLDLHEELKTHQDILEVIFDDSEEVVASLGAGTPMSILRYYYEALSQFNIEDQLQNIRVRVLLVHGQDDCIVDETSFDRLAAIPQVKLLKIDDHGHFIPLTASRLFNAELIGFLNAIN